MSDDDPKELGCPVCDSPVANVTFVGPGDAIVAPCGHHVPPGTVDGPDTDSG